MWWEKDKSTKYQSCMILDGTQSTPEPGADLNLIDLWSTDPVPTQVPGPVWIFGCRSKLFRCFCSTTRSYLCWLRPVPWIGQLRWCRPAPRLCNFALGFPSTNSARGWVPDCTSGLQVHVSTSACQSFGSAPGSVFLRLHRGPSALGLLQINLDPPPLRLHPSSSFSFVLARSIVALVSQVPVSIVSLTSLQVHLGLGSWMSPWFCLSSAWYSMQPGSTYISQSPDSPALQSKLHPGSSHLWLYHGVCLLQLLLLPVHRQLHTHL